MTARMPPQPVPDEPFELTVQVTDRQAWDLAQFVKRLTWQGVRDCAIDDDDARGMLRAIDRLRIGLRDAGYAPR